MVVGYECLLRFTGLDKLAAYGDKPHRNRGALGINWSDIGLPFTPVEYCHLLRSRSKPEVWAGCTAKTWRKGFDLRGAK